MLSSWADSLSPSSAEVAGAILSSGNRDGGRSLNAIVAFVTEIAGHNSVAASRRGYIGLSGANSAVGISTYANHILFRR